MFLCYTISKSLVAPAVKAYAECMRKVPNNSMVIPSDETLDNVVYQLISNDSNIKAKLNISQTEDTVTLSVNSEYVIEYLVAVFKVGEEVMGLLGKTKEVSKKFK